MVEATGLGLFLYHPVARCFLRGMKYLSILMVGVALATSGVADDKAEIERLKKEIEALKAKQEVHRLRQELAELKKQEVHRLRQVLKGPTVNYNQIKFIDSIPYLKGEKKPFTGTVIYYEDGFKIYETPFVDGKLHGTWIEYRKDGSKHWEIPYVDGKKHGTVIRYFEDGSTKTSEWVHGTGSSITYYEDGSKRRETPYVDGKEHGTEIWYDEDGSKYLEIVYENDKKISRKEY